MQMNPSRNKSIWQRLINAASRQPPCRIRQTLRMCAGGECAECVLKKCLTSFFELSGHAFGTILKSDALTFQSVSIWPSPVEHCSGRIEETLL